MDNSSVFNVNKYIGKIQFYDILTWIRIVFLFKATAMLFFGYC